MRLRIRYFLPELSTLPSVSCQNWIAYHVWSIWITTMINVTDHYEFTDSGRWIPMCFRQVQWSVHDIRWCNDQLSNWVHVRLVQQRIFSALLWDRQQSDSELWSIPFRGTIRFNQVPMFRLLWSRVRCLVFTMAWSVVSIFHPVYAAGVSEAICPPGTCVVGCHVEPKNWGTIVFDIHRQYYPSSNTTCTCSDVYGTQCVATCASHITNYEIISITGAGVVHAVCSPANFVLGCGVQPNSANQWDQFRTTFVVNTTACQCSDVYGTTCYAICGQLWQC